MDINELKSQIGSIVSDDASTDACLRRYENFLGRIEDRGENYIQNSFLKIRKFFERNLLLTAGLREEQNPGHAEDLQNAARLITSVSKADAAELIGYARKKIRAAVPGLREEDFQKEIERIVFEKLGDILDTDNLYMLVFAVYENDFDCIYRICTNLNALQRYAVYKVLASLHPDNPVYVSLYAKNSIVASAQDEFIETASLLPEGDIRRNHIESFALRLVKNTETGISQKYASAILKLLEPYLDRISNMSVYANLARRTGDKEAMKKILPLLQNNLEDTFCLTEFGKICKKMGYTEQVVFAMHKMEQLPTTPRLLVAYANLARAAKDKWRMEVSLKMLAERTDDLFCLNTYASLAKEMGDENAMIDAFFLLGEHTDNVFCASTFATLARVLEDKSAVQYSLQKLEPHIDTDEVCATTYAINALYAGTPAQLTMAQTALKNHLETPKCMDLYLDISETSRISVPPLSGVRARTDSVITHSDPDTAEKVA